MFHFVNVIPGVIERAGKVYLRLPKLLSMDIPIVREPVVRSTLFDKFVECFFAGVAFVNLSLFGLNVLPRAFLLKLGNNFFAFLLLGQLLVGIIFGIVYAINWHLKEGRTFFDSGKRHAWLRGILRYWLAMAISFYGFAKILHTQFAVSYIRADTAAGQLSGFDLTWNYFGHSYVLAVIIALLQIGGSILLLFRRTTLFGVAILLPVMVNIVLINLFYQIAIGAFLNSVLYSLGLLYLLLLHRSALMKVFWVPANDLPAVRLGFLKNVFRFLAIGLAFGSLFYAVRSNPVSPLAGKWTIDRMVRNRDTVKSNAWLTDSTAWSTAYIEERGILALCPNPYVFESRRSRRMSYKYDSARHQIQLVLFNNRNDSAVLQVSHYDGRNMQWDGIFDNDTLVIQLSKAGEAK
jgi:hypothetical protein